MSKVFECSTDNVSLHLKHIFQDNELNKDSVSEKCSLKKATEFRIWVTKILKEYMIKGFTLNDERFIKGNKYDVTIAKDNLNEEELSKLNDLTNIFLVFAEDEAKERHIMTMKDWINATDDLLKFIRKEILQNSDDIFHNQAVDKAEKEYEKYRVIQNQKYISSMDEFYNKYLEENKDE